MKVILENRISSVSARTEDPAFPVENLLDDHPKKVYKVNDAEDKYGEIRIETYDKTGACGLVNIVADRASVYIENPNGIDWQDTSIEWDNVSWEEYPTAWEKEVIFDTTQEYSTLWVEYPQFDASVVITIKLYIDSVYDDGRKIAAGVAKAGEVLEIKDIVYPVELSLVDYSVEKLLANGSLYYKKKDIVKRLSGTMVTDYDTYHDFLYGVGKKYGKTPAMWRIEEARCGSVIIYGMLSALPSASLQNTKINVINFEITEVL